MIKLILTDIDGTLCPEGSNSFNPEYYEVINKLIDKGIIFVAASGRHLMSVSDIFKPLIDKIWVISQNGAVISHREDYKLLKPIPKEWVKEFWGDLSSYAKTESVEAMAETADTSYCQYDNGSIYGILTNQYKYTVHATGGWHTIPDAEFSMVTLYHPESGEAFCDKYLKDKWKNRLNLFPTGKVWVDCVMPGISKGNAVKVLCEDLNISLKDIIAFGDNMNDISMIELAGTGYAVDNARKEVQDAADIVIPGYEQDGVLQVLKEILSQ